jgi:hypothetical protein
MKAALTAEERRMVDYLLGRLPEAERRGITDQVLADESVYQAVLAAEETLIDAYAGGELDDAEARMVETTLLVTELGRMKLHTAQALLHRQRLDAARRRQRRWLAAAAAVLLAGGIGFGVFEMWPGRVQPLAVASIVLRPDAYREKSAVQAVTIPSEGAVSFEIALAPADLAERYEVRARAAGRAELVLPGIRSGESLRFVVDRASLVSGRYEFEVFALDGVARRLIAFVPADLK